MSHPSREGQGGPNAPVWFGARVGRETRTEWWDCHTRPGKDKTVLIVCM